MGVKELRRSNLLFLAIFALAFPGAARGQIASFEVAQHGHAVGTARYRLTSTPQGYISTSLVRVAMQGLDYALSESESLTPAKHLQHVSLSATVNGTAVTARARPVDGQIVLDISASGRKTTTRLPEHAGVIFLPDFDPGALQILLSLALEQNSRNLWAILPKGKGSVAPVQLATLADMHGTLDGKAIPVHHLVATIDGAQTELFSGPENQLLQAELPQQGFALVRKGFVLQPPARAPAPPPQAQSAPAAKPQ